MKNTIHLSRSGRKKLISTFQEAACGGDSVENKSIFYKKNNKIVPMLCELLPKVLSKIIVGYAAEKYIIGYRVYRRYQSFECDFSGDCGYNAEIYFNDNPKKWKNVPDERSCYGGRQQIESNDNNFSINAYFAHKLFGIQDHVNSTVYFNMFMKKYYDKNTYLQEYFEDWKGCGYNWPINYKPKYKNCKNLKHIIIMSKLMFDVIQQIKFTEMVNGR